MMTSAFAVLTIFVALCAANGSQTYINEFPHPRLVVHYHPTGQQLTLEELGQALDRKVGAIEVDLHIRESDGQVVCNHNAATAESPTLTQVIELILKRKSGAETVNHDGLQFFLVLEPKQNSARLFDGIANVLRKYQQCFSTAVGPKDGPRGITVVITGSYPSEFYSHFEPAVIDPLCIAERHNYSGEVTDLSKHGRPVNWISIRHSKTPGDDAKRVRALQSATDHGSPGKFNVRIWDCHQDLALGLATGADSLNCDLAEIDPFLKMLADRRK
jgi:hypothetical protein